MSLTKEELDIIVNFLDSKAAELWNKAFHGKGLHYTEKDRLFEESRILSDLSSELLEG